MDIVTTSNFHATLLRGASCVRHAAPQLLLLCLLTALAPFQAK